ncbi:16S rRNA (adenine(1518)-N(6)/adenine(1519)-N(6))-dimethyltransferase RsmA [Candidatus Neptunochlamydia vexilliferae]|uniref:Ribosomal RNA small subunit methyltransferase A n=1 Tax=Candidatus Neptunichlamydia vexilliferae TaxID=1651774 RepID=A0ABS0AXN7_9BACT|nr:16S rRNA (adenine(1518)-N(6)/adenine(1519)-N(6))-dimethyltransferase RsmA [Candidatus Neptunochlamydia vexilliferae]MBF5058893.1 Ribosomal RNA small subunit methyltransferase A [Candidatus Neptunochlamydia vexilliferae]
MPLYKPSELHQFLKELGIHPKKGLSQNFLIDGNILNKLVAAAQLTPGEQVLEIGPGPGVLTEALLEAEAKVIAIEKDEKLAEHLRRFQNVEIIVDDFRNVSLKHLLKGKTKVIANIPYSLTGIILQELLPKRELITSIHLMVQKEVAERCTAKKGTKNYSSFTLFTDYHADAKLLFTVPRTCFYPKPKVDSAILELKLKPPPVSAPYEPLFELIRAAFQQRRKMLRASLKTFASIEDVNPALHQIGHAETARPQELTLQDFSDLWFALSKGQKTSARLENSGY